MAAATGQMMQKCHRQMMERTVQTMYELFQTCQIENMCAMIDQECRLDCTAFCDYNPFRGMYRGRSEIREWLIDHKSAVELKQYRFQVAEIDEARGTVLVQVQTQGKMRSTGKDFSFMGWDLVTFRNGHVYRMKCWGDDREFAKASKTPAIEVACKIAMAFFQHDMATMKKFVGNGKMKFLSNGVDPKTGEWSLDQWMKLMQKYDWQYTQRRMLFGTKNHVIFEYRCSHWCDNETGQSMMGHRPEFFRFYHHVTCDDNGGVREIEMHMSPQPSGMLFAKPHGAASKVGLIQHVQHSHVPREMMMHMQQQRGQKAM